MGSALVGRAALVGLIEHAFVTAVSQVVGQQPVVSAEPPSSGPVHSRWLAVIFVFCPGVRIALKTFFSLRAARAYVVSALDQSSIEEVSDEYALDGMREFSNGVAGQVQRFLEAGGIEASLGIPLIVRGRDELFQKAVMRRTRLEKEWEVFVGENRLVYRLEVDLDDEKCIEKLTFASQGSRVTEEIQFL